MNRCTEKDPNDREMRVGGESAFAIDENSHRAIWIFASEIEDASGFDRSNIDRLAGHRSELTAQHFAISKTLPGTFGPVHGIWIGAIEHQAKLVFDFHFRTGGVGRIGTNIDNETDFSRAIDCDSFSFTSLMCS